MSDLNNISLVGRLTKDAEKKAAGSTSYIAFSIANNTGYGDYKKTNFFDCKLWGKQGETLFSYLNKGKQVGVSGKLEMETWTSGDVEHKKWVLSTSDVILMADPKGKEEAIEGEMVSFPDKDPYKEAAERRAKEAHKEFNF